MFDANVLQRPVLANRINLVDCVEDVQTFDNLTENGVLVLELSDFLPARSQRDEERACIEVRAFIRRCNQASLVELPRPDLILEVHLFGLIRLLQAPDAPLDDTSPRVFRQRVQLLHFHDEVFLHERHQSIVVKLHLAHLKEVETSLRCLIDEKVNDDLTL